MKELSLAIEVASIVRNYLQQNSLMDKEQQKKALENQEKISNQLKHISRISK